jgi:hypothetical protein
MRYMRRSEFSSLSRRDLCRIATVIGLSSAINILVAACNNRRQAGEVMLDELFDEKNLPENPETAENITADQSNQEAEGELISPERRTIISLDTVTFVPLNADDAGVVEASLYSSTTPSLKFLPPINLLQAHAKLSCFLDRDDKEVSKLSFLIPPGTNVELPHLTYTGKVVEVSTKSNTEYSATKVVVKIDVDSISYFVTYSINGSCEVLAEEEREINLGEKIVKFRAETIVNQKSETQPQIIIGLRKEVNTESSKDEELVDLSFSNLVRLLDEDDDGNHIIVALSSASSAFE